MRILVTGARGQVGADVVRCCEQAGDTVIGLDHDDLDVTDREAVLSVLMSTRPDAVIHCAAWTDVDGCEADPTRAFVNNGLAVRWVAEACRRSPTHLVHLSTDYVFSGGQSRPYVEWDVTCPINVYGASKLAGEWEAATAGIGATIVRTSWVIGEHGSNMLTSTLRLLDERPTLSFVDDQRGHVTFSADLAGAIRRLAVDRRPGVHHVTNQGAVTWFDFAREVATVAGHDPARVRPIATADLDPPRPARRPANSVLENAVLKASGLPLLPDFRESLPAVLMALDRRG